MDKDLPLCENELDAENVKTQIAFIENEIINQLNNLKELKKTMKKRKSEGNVEAGIQKYSSTPF